MDFADDWWMMARKYPATIDCPGILVTRHKHIYSILNIIYIYIYINCLEKYPSFQTCCFLNFEPGGKRWFGTVFGNRKRPAGFVKPALARAHDMEQNLVEKT
jgi:hypothetical protein